MKIKRLRDLREDNDYTQADIAKILNMTRQQYNLYELGDRKIPIDKLQELANFYDVSIDYILGRTNYKNVVSAEMMDERNKRLNDYFHRLSYEDQDFILGKMVELHKDNGKNLKPKKDIG